MNYSEYNNRELSWLDFNNRVLDESYDEHNPLLEKFKFLSITSSNLDEFFMVRVASLKEQVESGYVTKDAAGLTPNQQLKEISKKVHEMNDKQYYCYNNILINQLSNENIHLSKFDSLDEAQLGFINEYFEDIIFPILTPMAIDSSRPFPLLASNQIYIVVLLNVNSIKKFAVLQIPSVVSRYIKIPDGLDGNKFLFIEDVICRNLDKLFVGNKIIDYSCFKITRNADLLFEEEEADDLLFEIEKRVKERKYGSPVRLELSLNSNKAIKRFLIKSLNILEEDLYLCDGPLDLTFLMDFSYSLKNKDKLRYEAKPPILSKIYKENDIFDLIKEKDLLLHHPYESFDPVLDLLTKSAKDKNVLAIKQTLYRVSYNSPVISALMLAAENGKQVTVLVELKARFDEENNINWARKLETAGCHVVYGLPGLKIHSKMLLVIRKEASGIKRYMHFGTGNYNDKTAKLYTDISLFTCNEAFAFDICSLFNYLTGYAEKPSLKMLVTAPTCLRDFFIYNIDREIDNVKNGHTGQIIFKMNSLVDPTLINKLYEASNAGVKIDLIVRGICCLKAGIKDLSVNIHVRSIVGRYLEHSRVYYFYNNDKDEIYLSSADLMQRNLDRRVETLFPILQHDLKAKLLGILEIQLKDTKKARYMKKNGIYTYYKKRILSAQETLYEKYLELE